jgi:hypothetical protein
MKNYFLFSCSSFPATLKMKSCEFVTSLIVRPIGQQIFCVHTQLQYTHASAEVSLIMQNKYIDLLALLMQYAIYNPVSKLQVPIFNKRLPAQKDHSCWIILLPQLLPLCVIFETVKMSNCSLVEGLNILVETK